MKQKYRIRGFSCVSRSLTEYQVSPRKGFGKYHQAPFGISKRYFNPILTWQTYGLCSIAAISELKVDLIFRAAHNSLVPVEVKGGAHMESGFLQESVEAPEAFSRFCCRLCDLWRRSYSGDRWNQVPELQRYCIYFCLIVSSSGGTLDNSGFLRYSTTTKGAEKTRKMDAASND